MEELREDLPEEQELSVEEEKKKLEAQQKALESWDPKADAEADELPLEKNDRLAMWIAGLITVGIPCLLLIGLIILVTLLLFTR